MDNQSLTVRVVVSESSLTGEELTRRMEISQGRQISIADS
jgi:hypothetical protein